ncbi:MAG: gliding motility-associated C-terminal domain-containing protein [Flavobacteriales bacterium]
MKKSFLFLLIGLFICTAKAQSDAVLQAGYKFLENKGQWEKEVKYRADLRSGFLYLTEKGLVFDFYDAKEFNRYIEAHHNKSAKRDFDKLKCHAYQVELEGSAGVNKVTTESKSPEYYNYFLGNNSDKWASYVYAYHRLKAEEVYPGVDLSIYSKVFNLKYDFIVKPGADASAIKLKFSGQESIKIINGRVVVKTSVNTVFEDKPYAYQVVNGKKINVPCTFKLKGQTISFHFPKGYDKNRELIIDPTLMFSTYSGSFSNNFGYTATFDKKGFLYSGSSAFGTQYPTTVGAYDVTFNGGIVDIAISKYDTTGTFMVYSTYVGGNSDEMPHSMITNSNDELFVYGTTSSLNFPTTVGCYDNNYNGGTALNLQNGLGTNYVNGSDIILFRLSGNGSQLLASTYIGGSQNDGLNSTPVNLLRYNYADEVRGEILIDNQNNVYITSCTRSADFPVTAGVFQPTYGGGTMDGVVFKMDNNLSTLIWSTFLGGTNDDAVFSLEIDKNGNIYVSGGTNSIDFPTTASAIQPAYNGGRSDGFITHISANGSSIINSTYWGSPTYDQVYFIELDRYNNVHVFGQTERMDSTFIHNVLYANYNSGQFISKLNPDLDSLIWSTVFGSGTGVPNISPTAFLVDVCNKIYLSGWGGGTNNLAQLNNNAGYTFGMPTTANAFQSTTDGSDFYLMVLEDDGSAMSYGSFFGGPISQEHVDGGTSRFDRNGRMYQSVCAGCGFNSDFPIEPNPGAVSPTNNSSCNNGVFKFDFNLPIVLAAFEHNEVECVNVPINFENNSYNGITFEWTFGDGNGSVQFEPTHTYSGSGTYTIMLVVSDTAACNFSDTAYSQITILSNSTGTLPSFQICQGETVQIGLAPSGTPGITYNWSPSAGLSQTNVPNPFASPGNTTNYTLLVSNGVCTDTLLQTVNVTTLQLTVSNDTIVCSDTVVVNLIANSQGTSNNYHWSSNNNFGDMLNTSPTDNSIAVTVNQPTMYYVQITANNCTLTDSVFIDYLAAAVTIVGNTFICEGDTITLTALNSNPNETFTFDWSPNGAIISGNGTPSIVISPNGTTLYILEATSATGCFFTLNHTVTVSNLSTTTISATASPDTIVAGASSQLNVTPGGYNYNWSPSLGLNNPNIQNPIATPLVTTTYIVTITDGDCVRFDTVRVVVKEYICGPPDVFVPNAFTPNGDGNNDILYVRGNNLTAIEFKVYHRWGELVFETNDQSKGWDGTYKGMLCDPAVFVYHLKALCIGGEEYIEKGNVTLLR